MTELPNRCYGCPYYKYDIFGWGYCKKYNQKIDLWEKLKDCEE